ncbi:hypothetical protein [Pararhodobacter zhoushanensis]|uniref:hypothetical protein n=1 Tax=Pararhodobacter zhoushanensis TaxID=2479545 RepID=UPI000F8EEF8E|nr:hypothetical protein [Pararhodobacter zhoushanensis]
MHITLSPCQGLPGAAETTVSVMNEVLTVDGVAYDLSGVPEGGEGRPVGGDHPFIGVVTRQGGEIRCTVRVILGDDAARDQPESGWSLSASAGAVALPAVRVEAGQ